MNFIRIRGIELVVGLAMALLLPPQRAAQGPLEAHLKVSKTEWVLGTPVELTVSVSNVSQTPVQTSLFVSPKSGELSLMISSDGSTFRRYLGPDWGTIEMGPRTFTFAPGSKQEASFSVLLNNDIDHGPTEPAWDFAFPHPGTYFIKANVLSGLGTLTSNVIQVVIQQPKGDDVPVWEAIRTDKRLARFLQDPRPGQATSGEPEKLQQLLNDHPQSSHALNMKRALDRHSRLTAKIQEMKKTRNSPQ